MDPLAKGGRVQVEICGDPRDAAVRDLAETHGLGLEFRGEGAAWQNGIVESFNGRLRDELLSSEIFQSLAEAKYLCNRWRLDYNHRRPQRALGNQTPTEFASGCDEAVLSRVERAQIKERLDMWTDETRIQKTHKWWSLCGVPVTLAVDPMAWLWDRGGGVRDLLLFLAI